jgi:uncharacterized protein YegJ (DUF2314 family)
MSIDPGIVIGPMIGVAGWLILSWLFRRPDFPPMQTSPDDPFMLQAQQKAKASIPQFLNLLRQPKDSALIKLHFVSDTGEVELLWAEVKEVLSDRELGVEMVTPPVTHAGKLDRFYRCKIEDVEDWQVRDTQGKLFGGFTQRAMFAIARRDGVKLPKRLLELERSYSEA